MNINKKILHKYLQPFVFIIVIFFLIFFFKNNTAQILQIFCQIQLIWLPIIIASIFLAHFVQAISWAFLTRNMGCQLSYFYLITIWFYSLLGLYIPGSIWMVVGRVYHLKTAGFSQKKSIYTVGLEQIFTLAAAFFIVCITPQILNYIKIPEYIGIIFAFFSLIVFFPKLWGKVIWKLGFRRIDFKLIPRIPFYILIIFFLGTVLNFYLLGITFLLTLHLFNFPVSGINIFNATAMTSASYLIGYLAIFTPNGIGVKEGVISFFLIKYIPLPSAVLFAFSRRLWTLLAHLCIFPFSYILYRKIKNALHQKNSEKQ